MPNHFVQVRQKDYVIQRGDFVKRGSRDAEPAAGLIGETVEFAKRTDYSVFAPNNRLPKVTKPKVAKARKPKKLYKDMSLTEQWNHIHSQENIQAHIKLNKDEGEKAMCHARGLKFSTDTFTNSCVDAHNGIARVVANCERPENQTFDFQAVEWKLSQVVKEASEILAHAAALQEYLHGAREGNKTLCKLRAEAKNGPSTQL